MAAARSGWFVRFIVALPLTVCRKGSDSGAVVVAVTELSSGCLAAAALAAASLLQLDLSCSLWLSTEHLARCSGLLTKLQAGKPPSFPCDGLLA